MPPEVSGPSILELVVVLLGYRPAFPDRRALHLRAFEHNPARNMTLSGAHNRYSRGADPVHCDPPTREKTVQALHVCQSRMKERMVAGAEEPVCAGIIVWYSFAHHALKWPLLITYL